MNAKKLNPYPAIEFGRTRYDAYLNEIAQTKEALELAWIAHYEAVMKFQKSKMWQAFAPNWEAFLKLPQNKGLFFAGSTYRQIRMNIPIAELAQTIANTTLSREDANAIGKKLNAVIPPDERTPMRLSVLALCYAYHEAYQIDKSVPDLPVIEGAYLTLCDERDSNTVSVDGHNYDFKQKGQVAALREYVVQGIQSRSKRITISIEENKQIAVLLRFLKAKGHNVPSDKKKLFLSWEEAKK